MENKSSISIVIPAYNEEKRIRPTLDKISDYLSRSDIIYEIIVVDDGSTDRTLDMVKDFARSNSHVKSLWNGQNYGKGYTVRKGMLSAKGDIIFFTDADLSTPIEEIEKCLPYFSNGYGVVIGSRSIDGADVRIRQPWYREKMGKIFNLLVKAVLLKGIIDTQCGFKGFRKEVVDTVFRKCRIDGFSFDVEALYLAKKYHFKIKEIPIEWNNSLLSKVDPLKHSLQMFKDLFNIKIKDLKGYYQ